MLQMEQLGVFVCADRKYCSFVYCSLPFNFDNKRAFLIYESLFKNGMKVITLLTSFVVNSTLLLKVKIQATSSSP